MFSNTLLKIYATRVPDVLFHYTSSAGLLGILSSGKIWATKIHYLNDNSELQLAFAQIRDEIQRRRKEPNADTELYENMLEALYSSEATNIVSHLLQKWAINSVNGVDTAKSVKDMLLVLTAQN